MAEKLEIIILAKDNASKAIGTVSGSLSSFGSKAGKIAAVGLAGAAVGIAAVGTAAVLLARDAAPLQGVQDAFYGIAEAAGVGGDAMLKALKEGSDGMITNRDLMMSFNTAAQLVGEDFAKKLPDAMGFLGKVAAATGEDMGFMMDSLVKGVGRLSPMILDNLGIQVTLADATAKASEQFGIEASQLSKAQIQAGMMDAVLEKLAINTAAMPEIAGSATQAFSSFETTLANTKDAIGLALLPAITPLIERFGELANDLLPLVAEKFVPLMERAGELADIFFATKDPIEGLKWVLMDIFGPEILTQFNEIVAQFTLLKDTVSEFVNGTLIPFVNEHWETLKQGLIAVGAILASGLIISGITILVGLIASLVSPITLVVLAIAALAMAWQNNWGGIQEKTATVLAWLTEAIGTALGWILDFWAAHGEQIMTTVQMAWDAIVSIIESVVAIITTIITAIVQFITEIWEKHGEQIKVTFQAMWDAVVTVIQSAITIIKNIFQLFANLLKGDWAAMGENLKAIWTALWDSVKAIFTAAKASLTVWFQIIKTVLTNIWDSLGGKLGELWDTAWAYITGLFETAKTTLQTIAEDVVERIRTAFEIDWAAVGTSIIDGIINAVNLGVGRLATAARGAAKSAFNAFMNFLKGKSPSKLFATAGHSIMEGVVVGIEDRNDWVQTAMEKSALGLYQVFGDSMLSNQPALMTAWTDMFQSMKTTSEADLKAMGSGYEDFFEILKDAFHDGYVTIQGETLTLSDYLITSGKATRDEVVDIYREMGLSLVDITDGTTGEIHHMYADAFDGMENISKEMWTQVVDDFIQNGFKIIDNTEDITGMLPELWDKAGTHIGKRVAHTMEDIVAKTDEGGFQATSIWNHHMQGMVDVTENATNDLKDVLDNSLGDISDYWKDAGSIFGGPNPITGFLPDFGDLYDPNDYYDPVGRKRAGGQNDDTKNGGDQPGTLEPGYFDSNGNWVPITDYVPPAIDDDAGAGTDILPNTPYPQDQDTRNQSITITGGITVIEPDSTKDIVEELSRLLV